MKLFIHVKSSAKENKVEKIDDAHFRVLVKAPPKEGRANQAVLDVLSEYFDVPKSSLSILSGKNSKQKVVEMSF
ncbi:MAG: DUF167 domain-containing protein [Candidatus Omnitrophica bacterium]|nr:DUF167 domain-containing protein [Candidatus Omnitrophota bacterium]